MELTQPIKIYVAASNIQAYEILEMLQQQGIASHVVEDNSPQSVWIGGLNSAIHKPQVWVSRDDEVAANSFLQDFEERQRLRIAVNQASVNRNQTVILVTCERCGEESEYPVVQAGSIQKCPQCHAYLDVDVDSEIAELDVGAPEPPTDSRYYE